MVNKMNLSTPSAMAGSFIACAEPMVDPSDEKLIETSIEIVIGSIRCQPSDNHHYVFFVRDNQLPTPNQFTYQLLAVLGSFLRALVFSAAVISDQSL